MLPSIFFKIFILFACQNGRAVAHMQLWTPRALGSQGMQGYNVSTFDYYATMPIGPSAVFPCHNRSVNIPADAPRTQYIAGQEITVTLDNPQGRVDHNGGSCQFSLSYDGWTFGVIRSIIGDCPKPLSYSFKIPEGAPAGDAILGWSWFNRNGVRELYHSCAAISIQSSSTSLTVPAMFIANNGDGCTTVEGDELVFPNPGESVEYAGIWKDKTPTRNDTKAPGCSPAVLEGSYVTLHSSGFSQVSPSGPASSGAASA